MSNAISVQSGPPAVVIVRHPKAGMEQEFQAWAEGIHQVMATQPGFKAYQCIPPVEGQSRDWFFVFTFDSQEALRAWMDSDTRARWQALSLHLTEGPGHTHVVSGLERLYGVPSVGEAPPPPLWKIAVATELGLAPTVYGVTLLLMMFPFYMRWSLWPQVVLSTAICVTLMNYAVMPALTRLLKRWLYGSGA